MVDLLKEELINLFSNPVLVTTLMMFLAFATYTDIKSLKIYDKFNIVFLIVRIIFIFIPIYGIGLTPSHLLGAIAGCLFLFIPAFILLHKMGGDIKFLSILGLYLGVYLTVFLLLISCITMLLFSVIRIIYRKLKYKKPKEETDEVEKIDVPFVLKVATYISNRAIIMNKLRQNDELTPFAPFFALSFVIMFIIFMCI